MDDLDSSSSSDDEAVIDQPSAQAAESKVEESEQNQTTAAEEVVDSEDELRVFKDPEPASKEWKNRQRTLVMTTRGLGGRMRHLVEDLCNLIPNTKRESKVQRK